MGAEDKARARPRGAGGGDADATARRAAETAREVARAAREAVAAVAREALADPLGAIVEAVTPKTELPQTCAELLQLHRAARRRRDAAPLESEARAEAAMEIERIEVQIARIERAADPPLC